MQPSCLSYRLSERERASFEETGLLAIEGALSPAQVRRLTEAVDERHAHQLAAGHAPERAMFFPDFVATDESFAELVDYEVVLPKVWGLLGWNIYLYHAHMIVTPPSGAPVSDATFGWHQDSGRVNLDIETHPRPRLSLKVAYFLSDLSEAGRGNFWVVPGSHRLDELQLPEGGHGQPEGAEAVLAAPGTAVLFDRRLWHSASPNWSDITRKVLFYGYGYRWIRTKDEMSVQGMWATSDPVRRQLLGWGTSANGFYSPGVDDVALRAWLEQHCPEDAS